MSLSIAELAALMVPITWGVSGLFITGLVKKWGSFTFGTLRIIPSFFILAIIAIPQGNIGNIPVNFAMELLLSGFLGIFIGDVLLFFGLKLVGPRRAAILFSTHALMTVYLAWVFLSETLTLQAIFGSILLTIGVVIATAFTKSKGPVHSWEEMPPKAWIAVAAILLAALAQAGGFIIAKPALVAGVDPLSALTLRIGAAAMGFFIARFVPLDFIKKTGNIIKVPWKDFAVILLSALIGVVLGNFMLLYALQSLSSGVVASFAMLVPIVQLPLIRVFTGQWPTYLSWVGAIIAVTGAVLIVLR